MNSMQITFGRKFPNKYLTTLMFTPKGYGYLEWIRAETSFSYVAIRKQVMELLDLGEEKLPVTTRCRCGSHPTRIGFIVDSSGIGFHQLYCENCCPRKPDFKEKIVDLKFSSVNSFSKKSDQGVFLRNLKCLLGVPRVDNEKADAIFSQIEKEQQAVAKADDLKNSVLKGQMVFSFA